MRRAAFLADEDVADAILLEDRIIDGKHGPARITEHDLDTEIGQGLDQDVCAGTFLGHGLYSLSGGAARVAMLRCDVNRERTVCFPFSRVTRNFITQSIAFSIKRNFRITRASPRRRG
jgi:hypothetical protein